MSFLRNLLGLRPKPAQSPFPGMIAMDDDFDLVDQVVLLETELSATKKALAFQDQQVDLLADKIRLAENAVVYLHDMLPNTTLIPDDGSPRYDFIAQTLKRLMSKGATLKLAP